MRANSLITLLESTKNQSLHPDEILIIDSSPDEQTKTILQKNFYKNLQYYKVSDDLRGLTKQRNFGISKVEKASEIVCFLDDDTVLEKDYFLNLIGTYSTFPNALGVGGYITNEVQWLKENEIDIKKSNRFYFDGFSRLEPSRFVIRKKLRLDCKLPPGFIPEFSHGRSVGFLPPTGKIYTVEQFMGGVSSFKKSVFLSFKFSEYFEGYGLYEDADFTSRIAKTGNLYVNTNARLAHYHNMAGRPNKYNYGKMIVRNGWYVWKVATPRPNFKNKVKWNIITIVLITIRFSNTFTSNNKTEAFTETIGRISGLFSLLFNRPKITY